MKHIVFQKARIVDPSCVRDEIGNLIILGDKILASGKEVLQNGIPENAECIDCTGKIIIPGLIDTSVSLLNNHRGFSDSLSSVSLSAAAGGVTSVVLSPDIYPILDSVFFLESLQKAADKQSVRIYTPATITKGLLGKELIEFSFLKEAGAVAFSEGQKTIASSCVMHSALASASDYDVLIMHHPQDPDLASGGLVHEGVHATMLGLPGIPVTAELITLERDLILARDTRCRYHANKISTSLSVAALERAKNDLNSISASVSINNLCFNEYDVGKYNTEFRLSPPIREEEDRLALIDGIRKGTIDTILSCHEPHERDSKDLPFYDSPSGVSGLETLLPAALRLYHNSDIPLLRLVDALSTSPAQVLKLPGGTLKSGSCADFVVLDLNAPWIFSPENMIFPNKSTCFRDAHFQGKILQTWVRGHKIYESPKNIKP